MNYEIVCTRGPTKGRRWKVTPNGLKIGRDKSCEIQVGDLSAELFHCIVKMADGKPMVLNLASSKGVDVNGTNVDEAELKQNDLIRVGNEQFVVMESGGKNLGSFVRNVSICVILLGLAVIGAHFCRQKFFTSKPQLTTPAADVVKETPESVTTNRVVRLVGEEIVTTNRVVRIVDNVVVTNYVIEVRRGEDGVSSQELTGPAGQQKQGVAAKNAAIADVEEVSADLPPYEVIDSKKALAMGGASGGDKVRLVANANETFDIIHIFTEECKTKTLFVPETNLIIPGSASFLVVGGGGGVNGSQGGGAGGVVLREAENLVPGTVYVYVGAGGRCDQNGEDSLLTIGGTTLTAIGGGAGSDYSGGSPGGTRVGYGQELQSKSTSGGIGRVAPMDYEHRNYGGGAGLKSSVSGKAEIYASGGHACLCAPNMHENKFSGVANSGSGACFGVQDGDKWGNYWSVVGKVVGGSGIVVVRYAVKKPSGRFVAGDVALTYPEPDSGVKSARVDGVEWRYFVGNDGTVTIGCHGEGSLNHPDLWTPAIGTNAFRGVVHIPDRIDGKPVRRIGKGAFQGCAGVTTFVVPEGVTHCGPRAFARCDKLEAVMYPKSLNWLGEGQVYRSPKVRRLHFLTVPPKANYGCCPFKGIDKKVRLLVPFAMIGQWRNLPEKYGYEFACYEHRCGDGCHRPRCLIEITDDEKEEARRTGAGFIYEEVDWKDVRDLKHMRSWFVNRIEGVWRRYDALSQQRDLSPLKLYAFDALATHRAVIYATTMFFNAMEPVSFRYSVDDRAMIMVDDEVVLDFKMDWWRTYSTNKPVVYDKDGWHRVVIVGVNGGGDSGGVVMFKRGSDKNWRWFESGLDGKEFRVTAEDARRAVNDIVHAKANKK